jgi:hypothetical protein
LGRASGASLSRSPPACSPPRRAAAATALSQDQSFSFALFIGVELIAFHDGFRPETRGGDTPQLRHLKQARGRRPERTGARLLPHPLPPVLWRVEFLPKCGSEPALADAAVMIRDGLDSVDLALIIRRKHMPLEFRECTDAIAKSQLFLFFSFGAGHLGAVANTSLVPLTAVLL